MIGITPPEELEELHLQRAPRGEVAVAALGREGEVLGARPDQARLAEPGAGGDHGDRLAAAHRPLLGEGDERRGRHEQAAARARREVVEQDHLADAEPAREGLLVEAPGQVGERRRALGDRRGDGEGSHVRGRAAGLGEEELGGLVEGRVLVAREDGLEERLLPSASKMARRVLVPPMSPTRYVGPLAARPRFLAALMA